MEMAVEHRQVEHRQGSKMEMADYLSRFLSAEAPETSHYGENFTVAKIRMINAVLKPKDKTKPRGQKMNKIQPKLMVMGGEQSCFDTTKSVPSNENERKDEYANIHHEHERSIEGVFTCNRRLTNQRRDICIPAEICKYRRKRFRRCSHCLNYSCRPSFLMNYNRNLFISNNYNSKPPTLKNYSCKPSILQNYSEKPFTLKNYSSKPLTLNNLSNLNDKNMSNSPEKNDPPASAIVNTSTNSANVNLNVVLNHLNQSPSVSSDSDNEVIPPEKLDIKQTNCKKLNTIISFPHQFPGLSYPLVQNDKWIYSIVPPDSKIRKKIEHPEALSLKLNEANIEKNYVLTYLQENKNYKFGALISRAFSALRFVPHSKTELTPFEAYHGREANTVLRNLTKKPSLKNLNWNNVVNQNLSCLDKAGNVPEVELTLDWEKKSDLVYAPQNRKTPIFLDDEVVADPKAQEVVDPKEIRSPKAPTWLKKHKTSSTIVYQRTGKTDPKDPRRYKRLPLQIEKLTKHTVQMTKGSLLRRSGVSFRSAVEESLIETE